MKIEYTAGLVFDPGEEDTARMFSEISKLPDYTPEKHELMAYLLTLALRMEWHRADRARQIERDSQARKAAAKRRKDRKHGGP